MSLRIDDDLWPAIKQHPWKWESGRVSIVGAIIHATRSGIPGRAAEIEYRSACNWFLSPHNYVDVNGVRAGPGKPWFGGMSTYIIGGGRRALCVPPDLVPRFSAGIHDFRAISIEVGQGTNGDPYDQRDIEMVLETLDYHGLGTNRIPFVDGNNTGWPGIVGHEDTAQGKGAGKSDPGPLFWEAWSTLLAQEDDMSAEDRARLDRMERLIGGNGIDLDGDGVAEVFGEEALNIASDRGWSAFLGINIARQEAAAAAAAAQQAVPDHEHGGVKR